MSFGLEEFRRDVEDAGEWTPTNYYSSVTFENAESTYEAAEHSVAWLVFVGLAERKSPGLRSRCTTAPFVRSVVQDFFKSRALRLDSQCNGGANSGSSSLISGTFSKSTLAMLDPSIIR